MIGTLRTMALPHGQLTGNPWIDVLIVLGLLGGAWAFIRLPLRGVQNYKRKFDDFCNDWFGEPPRDGVEEKPGVMRRLSAIEAEIHPNSGGSIKDAVNAIRKDTEATRKALDAHLASCVTDARGEPSR